MTKKLLLTTALVSALSSGTTAYATDFIVHIQAIILLLLIIRHMLALALLTKQWKLNITMKLIM